MRSIDPTRRLREATDNPIEGWSDKLLAESMRTMLKTVGEMGEELTARGYSVTCNRFVNGMPTTVTIRKEVIL